MAGHRPTPGFLLWRLAMKWRVAVDRAVASLGLTHAQYSLLASLYGMARDGRRPSQRELADHIGLEPIYVSKLTRALEAAGLVERTGHPSDARAVQLALTTDGVEVVEQAIVIVGELQDRLTGPLGGTRSKATRALADTLTTLLAVPIPDATGEEP